MGSEMETRFAYVIPNIILRCFCGTLYHNCTRNLGTLNPTPETSQVTSAAAATSASGSCTGCAAAGADASCLEFKGFFCHAFTPGD